MAATRIAVIGAGLIGREHCKLVSKSSATELAGIADISAEAHLIADEYDTPLFADYPELLDQVKPDGAIIALPNHIHKDAALACLERGIPCLVEKPIAGTMDDAFAIAGASEQAGIPVLVGHHRRHSPDMRTARETISTDRIGDLIAVNGLWLAHKPDPYFEADWRRRPGGGPILINLIHEIDCLRFIAGEIDEVNAFTSSAVRGFPVEETISISIRFQSGVLGTFLMSDAVASPFTWEMMSGQALYFPSQPGDCYVFGGRHGSLTLPGMKLWTHEDRTGHWQTPIKSEEIGLDGTAAYENQLSHFLDVIAGRAEPVCGPADAARTLAGTLAVARSAEERRNVSPNEFFIG